MNKLERIIAAGVFALGLARTQADANTRYRTYIDQNGREWTVVQKQAKNGLIFDDKLVDPKTGEEIELPKGSVIDKINSAKVDKIIVKGGIKNGNYCDVYPLALKLYMKNKNVKQPEQSSLAKLLKKKEKKIVTGDEYRNLATIACLECFRHGNRIGDEEEFIPLDELDKAGIDIRKSYTIYSLDKELYEKGKEKITKGSFIVEKDLELQCNSQGESLPKKIRLSDIIYYLPNIGIVKLKNGYSVNCSAGNFVLLERKKEKINVAGFDKVKITNERHEFGSENIIAFDQAGFENARKDLLINKQLYLATLIKKDTNAKIWKKKHYDVIHSNGNRYEIEYYREAPGRIREIKINGISVEHIPSVISGEVTARGIHKYEDEYYTHTSYKNGQCAYVIKPFMFAFSIDHNVVSKGRNDLKNGRLSNNEEITYSVWSIEAVNQEQLDAFFREPQKYANNIIYLKNEQNNGSR